MIKARRDLTPAEESWQELWDEACKLSLDEQLYLLCSKTANDEAWALEQFSDRRLLWVTRLLRDQEHEEKKYSHLLDTMVKLWTTN